MRVIAFILLLLPLLLQADECPRPEIEFRSGLEQLGERVLNSPETVFPTLKMAVDAQVAFRRPVRFIQTEIEDVPRFPSFSRCERSFFRVATVNTTVDEIITERGWMSGWMRRSEELADKNVTGEDSGYDALPPSAPFEDRIVEYVRVKDLPSAFPKHSSVVGVLEDPIRTLSVGYHTGASSADPGKHMRMDEIEVGPCARSPECQRLDAVDSSRVFQEKGLIPRYSTEGEFAVEMQIPPSCVIATYRIVFQKVDKVCYSDTNNNCNF